MELRKKIEALLFSSGKRMHIQEIARLCSAPPDRVKNELIQLAADYESKDSSLVIQNDGEYWKFATKADYSNIVKGIVKETELSKTLMETLATIAFKYPIKQSDLIKMRTNKAYDHLMELEKMGYITRQKYGRTKIIKLTERFFNYFNLPEEGLKDKFKDFQSLADAIENKEEEIEKIKEDQKKMSKEAKEDEEKMAKEVDLIDEKGHKVKLDVVDEAEEKTEEEQKETKVEKYSDKVGKLDVVDEEEPQEVKVDGASNVDGAVEDVLGVDDEEMQKKKYDELLDEVTGKENNEEQEEQQDDSKSEEKSNEGVEEGKQDSGSEAANEEQGEEEQEPKAEDDSKESINEEEISDEEKKKEQELKVEDDSEENIDEEETGAEEE